MKLEPFGRDVTEGIAYRNNRVGSPNVLVFPSADESGRERTGNRTGQPPEGQLESIRE